MTADELQKDGRRSTQRRVIIWVAVAIVLVLAPLAVALSAGFWNGSGTPTAASTSTATPRASDHSEPAPSPTPSVPPAVAGTAIPAECANIYTKDWTPEMDGFVLNPAWAADPMRGKQEGTNNAEFVTLLTTTTKLTCHWGSPVGGSGRAVITNVAELTSDQQTEAIAVAQTSGYTCFAELDGTRCVIETVPDSDGQSGESHFFRDGVWIATLWINLQPDGYTRDIVTAIFGA